MTTALDKALRREILINKRAYTLTVDPDGLKLVEKGRRNGVERTWGSLLNADDQARQSAVTPSGI